MMSCAQILPHRSAGLVKEESEKDFAVVDFICKGFGKWDVRKWEEYYETYKCLHKKPGLSGRECFAASTAETHLCKMKEILEGQDSTFMGTFRIFRDIGKNESGPSVVAVIENPGKVTTPKPLASPRPVVLLRADMDAIAVTETTGLDYASTKEGVSHACGHDMHVTTLIAAVKMLLDLKTSWSGTLIALFQPFEETGLGARAMVNDGLYGEKFGIPIPDYCLGAHVSPEQAGTVNLSRGTAFNRSDAWRITLRGRGGHGAAPETTIDPIVMISSCVTRLQTIVSREIAPRFAGVLTVGRIQGGSAVNVIPSEAFIEVSMRSDSNELAEQMEKALRRIVAAEVRASSPDFTPSESPEEQGREDANPRFERITQIPLLTNDDQITPNIAAAFLAVFGKTEFLDFAPAAAGSEDFPNLARSSPDKDQPDIPYCYWRYGSTDERRWKEAGGDLGRIPSNHSSNFFPQLDISADNDPLKIGTKALVAAALKQLKLNS